MSNGSSKGAKFERELINQARKDKHIAFRSGNNSPINVSIINPDEKKIKFIKCKNGISEAECKKIEKKFSKLRGFYWIDFKIMQK